MNTIKKSNVVKIEGILSEINLNEGSFKNKKTDQVIKSIGGTVKVRVTQPINGVDTELEIPITLFAAELKNDGGINPAYTSIMEVKNSYMPISVAGIEKADRVRITGASLEMNEYWNKKNEFVRFPRIKASFINRLNANDEFNPEATFTSVMCIKSITPEEDKEGEETGRYKIRGVIPTWNGESVDIFDYVVSSPKAIATITSNWEVYDTVRVTGRINFSSVTEKIVHESFGEDAVVDYKTTSISELIITGGDPNPLDEGFGYDKNEIRSAIRQKEEENKNSKPTDSKPKSALGNDYGF